MKGRRWAGKEVEIAGEGKQEGKLWQICRTQEAWLILVSHQWDTEVFCTAAVNPFNVS